MPNRQITAVVFGSPAGVILARPLLAPARRGGASGHPQAQAPRGRHAQPTPLGLLRGPRSRQPIPDARGARRERELLAGRVPGRR